MNTDFYADRRVIVTGGAGMVGSHLVERLVALGADVLVLDDLSRGRTYIPGVNIVPVDVGDERAITSHLRGAFALFNLAAFVAGVQYNQHNHATMFERNARLQTVPILAAAALGIPHVLQTSSVCVYSPDHNHPAREADGHTGEPHAANNGYAWAKRMGEQVVRWATLEHAVTVRPSNIYGPRDYFDDRAHVIPALIKKALTEPVLRVNGSGHERREFVYVTDVAEAMTVALAHGAHGGVYNIGTSGDTCVSIRQLVALIQAATGTLDREVVYTSDYNAGDPARWSDCTTIHALGWHHATSLEDGIARSVEWYRRGR